MADELKAVRSDLEFELIPSSGGRFEVTYDGALVFSKAKTNRFPEPGEVSGLIGK